MTTVGIRNLPSATKAVAGASSKALGFSSLASVDSSSGRKSHAVKPPPKALKADHQAATKSQSGESAEAIAWLSVVRDDEKMLASALMHVSIDTVNEDGETLLLCACRSAAPRAPPASAVQLWCP